MASSSSSSTQTQTESNPLFERQFDHPSGILNVRHPIADWKQFPLAQHTIQLVQDYLSTLDELVLWEVAKAITGSLFVFNNGVLHAREYDVTSTKGVHICKKHLQDYCAMCVGRASSANLSVLYSILHKFAGQIVVVDEKKSHD